MKTINMLLSKIETSYLELTIVDNDLILLALRDYKFGMEVYTIYWGTYDDFCGVELTPVATLMSKEMVKRRMCKELAKSNNCIEETY